MFARKIGHKIVARFCNRHAIRFPGDKSESKALQILFYLHPPDRAAADPRVPVFRYFIQQSAECFNETFKYGVGRQVSGIGDFVNMFRLKQGHNSKTRKRKGKKGANVRPTPKARWPTPNTSRPTPSAIIPNTQDSY
jgi:hypothetical protein